jgi:hypothetical protein
MKLRNLRETIDGLDEILYRNECPSETFYKCLDPESVRVIKHAIAWLMDIGEQK